MVALVSSHNIFLSCVFLAKKRKKKPNKLTLQNEEGTTETSGHVAPSSGCYYHYYYYHCGFAQKEFDAASVHVPIRKVT